MTSFILHILGMCFMLLDHIWATTGGAEWMSCVGRLAFPLFAFLNAEGFFHTRDVKKYAIRLFLFALISEIPFDFMYGGQLFYPFHQNVLWTFLLALGGMVLLEKARKQTLLWKRIALCTLVCAGGFLLGYGLMVDYYGAGVLSIFVFYFFRGKKWWCLAGQVLCLYFLNVVLLGGYYYSIPLFGTEFKLVQQSLALLALIPVWLYNGQRGHHSSFLRYFCYAFYPAHITVLVMCSYYLC